MKDGESQVAATPLQPGRGPNIPNTYLIRIRAFRLGASCSVIVEEASTPKKTDAPEW